MSDGAFEDEEAAVPDADAKQSSLVGRRAAIHLDARAGAGRRRLRLPVTGSKPDVLADSRAGLRGFLRSRRLATCEEQVRPLAYRLDAGTALERHSVGDASAVPAQGRTDARS